MSTPSPLNDRDGVFVEIIGGRPVVSIMCSDSAKLDELTTLARRIMAAILVTAS